MQYIERSITAAIMQALPYYPVIVITGPRQVGKTTLCRHIFADYKEYNLETIALRSAIAEDPVGFIDSCGQCVLIDEVQQLPELMSYIQVEVDKNPDRKFILTGSNNFALLESVTQSMAGRAALFTLLPFSMDEVGDYKLQPTDSLLLKGFYPGVVVKNTPVEMFFYNYYSTYIERDVRQVKDIANLSAFQLFVKLLAGRTGSEFNASALANEIGVSAPTIKSWFGVLQASYIAFALQPFYTNIAKRLTKMPKVYFYDTGLLCHLLGITTPEQLAVHPLRGAVFENLAVTELMKQRFKRAKAPNLYFYRENAGREVDILQDNGLTYDLYEVKSSCTYTPAFMKNIKYLRELFPDRIAQAKVVYDGEAIPPNIINIRQL